MGKKQTEIIVLVYFFYLKLSVYRFMSEINMTDGSVDLLTDFHGKNDFLFFFKQFI